MATISRPYQRTPVLSADRRRARQRRDALPYRHPRVDFGTSSRSTRDASSPMFRSRAWIFSGLTPSDAAVETKPDSCPTLSAARSCSGTGRKPCWRLRQNWAWCSIRRPAPCQPTGWKKRGLFEALSGQVSARASGAYVQPVIIFDQRVAYQYLRQIGLQVDQPMREAGLSLEGTDVIATPGQIGRELKMDATLVYLGARLQTFSDGEVPLVIQEIQPQIIDVSAQAEVARQILSQPLTVVVPNAGAAGPGIRSCTMCRCLPTCLACRVAGNGVQVVLNTGGLSEMLHACAKTARTAPPWDAKFIFNDTTPACSR
ncbi:MAG: peptidoglycan binding domain-containing protein [Ignavibacteriales bacterium]|nr:peptidoglycan binding domain-containing protein [Ignavibacteriales bacterium]